MGHTKGVGEIVAGFGGSLLWGGRPIKTNPYGGIARLEKNHWCEMTVIFFCEGREGFWIASQPIPPPLFETIPGEERGGFSDCCWWPRFSSRNHFGNPCESLEEHCGAWRDSFYADSEAAVERNHMDKG